MKKKSQSKSRNQIRIVNVDPALFNIVKERSKINLRSIGKEAEVLIKIAVGSLSKSESVK
jgi:hypothetical protein